MNDELRKLIIDSIKDLKSFTMEQAPDVVQQYLTAQFIEASMAVFFGVVSLILGGLALRWSIRECKKDFNSPLGPGPGIFGIALGICGLMLIFSYAPDAIKIKYMPKGYLLEHVFHSGCKR